MQRSWRAQGRTAAAAAANWAQNIALTVVPFDTADTSDILASYRSISMVLEYTIPGGGLWSPWYAPFLPSPATWSRYYSRTMMDNLPDANYVREGTMRRTSG